MDLEINLSNRKIVSLDNHRFICRFEKTTGKHRLHSEEDPILNSIVDLIISLGQSLDFYNNKNLSLLEKIRQIIPTNNFDLFSIESKLQYIKDLIELNQRKIKILSRKEDFEKILKNQEQLFDIQQENQKLLRDIKRLILN